MYKIFENLINPYSNSKIEPTNKKVFTFLWQSTKGLRFYILLLILFTALMGIFEAALFAMLGKLIDWLSLISPKELWEKEGQSLLILCLIILSSILIVSFQSIIKNQVLSGNFSMQLRWKFHRLILSQSINFFENELAGRVSSKVMQTSVAIRDTCFLVCDILVYIIIYFATMSAILLGFDVLFFIPFAIWLIAYILALFYFIPRLSEISQLQADSRSLMTGRITDAYTNIMTVKLFSHSNKEALYAKESMDCFLDNVKKQMRLISSFEIVNHILNVLLIITTTGFALYLWSQSLVGIGAIAAATAMALRLNGIAHWIMFEMSSLFENIGIVKDGINTFSKMQSVKDEKNAKKLNVQNANIVFENVCFSYDDNNDIIKNLNLDIKSGQKIGLVGRSGAGKSTLINLLLRIYDLKSGRILIDNIDISTITQDSLRSQIGMVTQDTSLLHRSVKHNLLYGIDFVSDNEMIEATKKAQAEQFILSLKDSKGRTGFDAFVGERGIKLSGGQRQRIAIARVLIKNAPILVLDEATSALDSEVESIIQENLYKLMENKTVIAIAHRLSTIAAMDKLIVLDKGQIIEQGTHQELLDKNGLYANLWKHQSGGFIS